MFTQTMSLKLSSDQFHTGINEICRQLDGKRSDEYLNGLLKEVEETNGMLFEAVKNDEAREGIKEESQRLRESLSSARRYIGSFQFEPDAALKSIAKTLLKVMGEYGSFYRMDVHSRLTQVQAMLSKLNEPEMQALVDKIPGLTERLKNIQVAADALLKQLTEVGREFGELKLQKGKLELKRLVVANLDKLLAYLYDMAYKDPDNYGKDYEAVVSIITHVNGLYKAKVRKKGGNEEGPEGSEGSDADAPTPEVPDTPEPPEGPEPPDDPDASATPSGE